MPRPSLVFLACCVLSTACAAQNLRLPFEGRWFVMQGGDTPNVNQHMAVEPQWFGVDFAKLGGPSQRAVAAPGATSVEQFYCWGATVLAPHDGEVVAVANDFPDNALGVKDTSHPAGNHVVIQVAPERYLFLAHFQRGSVTVQAGTKVTRGQPVGRCGNSGNSDFPHVHLHVQDRAPLNTGRGQNPVFEGMNVELNGQRFDNVTWPLIRGLFVEPH